MSHEQLPALTLALFAASAANATAAHHDAYVHRPRLPLQVIEDRAGDRGDCPHSRTFTRRWGDRGVDSIVPLQELFYQNHYDTDRRADGRYATDRQRSSGPSGMGDGLTCLPISRHRLDGHSGSMKRNTRQTAAI
jgi:hypothetical protein